MKLDKLAFKYNAKHKHRINDRQKEQLKNWRSFNEGQQQNWDYNLIGSSRNDKRPSKIILHPTSVCFSNFVCRQKTNKKKIAGEKTKSLTIEVTLKVWGQINWIYNDRPSPSRVTSSEKAQNWGRGFVANEFWRLNVEVAGKNNYISRKSYKKVQCV